MRWYSNIYLFAFNIILSCAGNVKLIKREKKIDIARLAAFPQGTELLLIDDYVNDHKTYRLEDFFWTGSGDGGFDNEDSYTWDTNIQSTVYTTKTIFSTLYMETTPTTVLNTNQSEPVNTSCITCTTQRSEINPTPTYSSDIDSVENADSQYWLLTVLKSDGKDPVIEDLTNSLTRLYKIAFQRQQERHLGVTPRVKREYKPVNVFIHKIDKSPDNGNEKVEVLYHVSMAGKPVDPITASADMTLVTDQEVREELGYPFSIKAEPYIKHATPPAHHSTSETRQAWLVISSAIAAILIVLVAIALFSFCLTNRHPSSSPSQQQQQQHQQQQPTNKLTLSPHHNNLTSFSAVDNSYHVSQYNKHGQLIVDKNRGFLGNKDNLDKVGDRVDRSDRVGERGERVDKDNRGDRGYYHGNKKLDRVVQDSSPTYIHYRSEDNLVERGVSAHSSGSCSSTGSSITVADGSPVMLVKEPPVGVKKKRYQFRPRAAMNRTAPINTTVATINITPQRNTAANNSKRLSITSSTNDSSDTNSASPPGDSITGHSVRSYLSMPSVKNFPRANGHPEPLSKVLEPLSVVHLDLDTNPTNDGSLDGVGLETTAKLPPPVAALRTRHGSLATASDPGVIGPLVWNLHREEFGDNTNSPSSGNVTKMRKRFHGLMDDTFSLFSAATTAAGGGSGSDGGGRITTVQQVKKSHSAEIGNCAGTGNSEDEVMGRVALRPTSCVVPIRGGPVIYGTSQPRGAWGETQSCLAARPGSAPHVDIHHVRAEGRLTADDPAIPLIAAIKTEIGKIGTGKIQTKSVNTPTKYK